MGGRNKRVSEMTAEELERHRARWRAYYAENREERKAYQRRYYRKHYDECRKSIRACQSRRQVEKLRAAIQEQTKERNYG
jgi:transcription initiation factor IIE alpha subunit